MSAADLTAAQRAAYEKDGFLVLKGLFSRPEMADITNWTEELQAWDEAPGKYMKYFEGSLTEPGQRLLCRIE
ncbi:MAG: phytanoyl-CoA dioxygenase family protein, partial [Alphaproteobacteria bacterium]|nr:phytanoyl-CoA dioxygenase family protein [Alphaproteobacteria bacterium]